MNSSAKDLMEMENKATELFNYHAAGARGTYQTDVQQAIATGTLLQGIAAIRAQRLAEEDAQAIKPHQPSAHKPERPSRISKPKAVNEMG